MVPSGQEEETRVRVRYASYSCRTEKKSSKISVRVTATEDGRYGARHAAKGLKENGPQGWG